ncbi:MAG: Histidinol dehydrogenase [Alphaproteobacteria bacterium MarineAlpha11_Bin1]|nr:MAG: Histidinol dehydrogenase [Alphaproteobacteria bacterium MarineAlpha11_Bin1]|tara:strand:+ start:2176 stop:3468 length:1293 start_codon:yes stop_codon:yes gene_type:complete
MPLRLSNRASGFAEDFDRYVGRRREVGEDVSAVVSEIIADVRSRGDAAVIDYTSRFDKLDISEGLRVDPALIDSAKGACRSEEIAALEMAANRIRAFHVRERPEGISYTDEEGVWLGSRWRPLSAVGIYVPGGTAAYPSSVLMNAIPANVAGVPRIVMVVPTPSGEINPLVLAAADLARVDEIYRIGGAQAVAALAFGTESIAPVDKITGPGNAYVAESKRQVFGTVGIDMIAGPSEIVVIADSENDPSWIAADLLSQAEHDTSSQSVLITDSGALADSVADAIEQLLEDLPRHDIARKSWEDHGAIILVDTLDRAVELVDRIAPEHLELAVEDPDGLASEISHAGAIFMGRHTPEAIGDYIAGPNHVLPTGQSARFSSGLSVIDFMKRTTMVSCDPAALSRIGPAAVTLADAEGLEAHSRSLSIRLNKR